MPKKRENYCLRVLKDAHSPYRWLIKYGTRELVIIYVMKLLEAYSCYSMLYILLLFLTDEFGFTDIQAGWIYAWMGAMSTIYGILVGTLIDFLGVKISLIIGFGILLVSRFAIVFVTSKFWVCFFIIATLPLGQAMGIPVLQIAVKRYTFEHFSETVRTDKEGRAVKQIGNQSIAFDLFYIMMNVSAAIVGPVLDGFRALSRKTGPLSFKYHGHNFAEYRLLILSGAIMNIFAFVLPCLPWFRMRFKVLPPRSPKDDEVELQFDPPLTLSNFEPRTVLVLRSRKAVERALARAGLEWSDALTKFKDARFTLLEEQSVRRGDILALALDSGGAELAVGAEVSVNGAAPGRVSRVNDDGTYNVTYDHDDDHNDDKDAPGYRLVRTRNSWFAVGREDEPPYLPPEALKPASCVQCSAFGVWKDKELWKYLWVVVMLMGVRLVFRHLDATFPKYMVRTHGKEVPFGIIISLNPILIVLIVGLVVPFLKSISNYDLIAWGALISAISPFAMVFNNSLAGGIMFVALLSLGEAMWSPRLYEYTVIVAPDQKEGTFMAFSHMPSFVANFISGPMSGILLQRFCPAQGKLHCEMMWLIIGLSSISSPILLLALKKCLRSKTDIANPTRVPDFLRLCFRWCKCCKCCGCETDLEEEETRVGLLDDQEDHKKV